MIRICGDYKTLINKVAKHDKCPAPKTEDLLNTLNGGKTKLDLSHAYQQLLLHKDSKELLTLNTHKGLFQPNRLQYGIHSTMGIFQREMEKRLCGILFTIVRMDDILISGKSNEEHLQNLEKVNTILHKLWVKLKKARCIFLSKEVTYLAFLINERRVFPVKEKIEDMLNAKSPEYVTQLKLFLGMINYYWRHLPNLTSVLEPLHNLLRKNIKRRWGRKEKQF